MPYWRRDVLGAEHVEEGVEAFGGPVFGDVQQPPAAVVDLVDDRGGELLLHRRFTGRRARRGVSVRDQPEP